MEKIISIDYWLKKIWTAVWDTIMQIAFPKENFSSKEDLFKFIEKNNYSIIILWNPKTNENFFSDQEKICQDFFEELEKKFWEKNKNIHDNDHEKNIEKNSKPKKIIFLDERYSSKIAQQKMRNIWLSQKKWKKFEDNLSAQVLLEDYFNSK